MTLHDNELPIFFLTLSDGLEHQAPPPLIGFVLELFAPIGYLGRSFILLQDWRQPQTRIEFQPKQSIFNRFG